MGQTQRGNSKYLSEFLLFQQESFAFVIFWHTYQIPLQPKVIKTMKGNKKKLNRQKAERLDFAEAYNKALARRRRENKVWDRHRPHRPCGEYDEFRYLRVKDINKVNPIEYWNVESATVVFVAPRLRALIEGMEGCGATPGSYFDIDEDGNFVKGGMRSAMEGCVDLSDNKDVDSTWKGWHKVLKKYNMLSTR